MSINRSVHLLEANDPYYILFAEWVINGEIYSGEVSYYNDREMGKFTFGNFQIILSKLPQPKLEVHHLKNLIRNCVNTYIKENCNQE